MPPFTRSKLKEAMAIPYGGSVTRLHAYDLVEEGTHCPNCHVEILLAQVVYLHRACSNIVCASCFETNLSPVVGSDVCLICHAQLAEPSAEDGLPNWPFTYTGIPLSQFSGHPWTTIQYPQGLCTAREEPTDDAMVWSPLSSPPKKCPSSGVGLPATASNSTIVAAATSTATFSDYIVRLAAGIDEQERKIGDFESQGGTARYQGRVTSQSNITLQYPKILSPMDLDSPDFARRNMTNPGYQFTNKNDDQNTFNSSLMNNTASGQQYAPTCWNQPNTTAQYESVTQTEPQPPPPHPPRGPKHPHKRKMDGADQESETSPDNGQRSTKVRFKEPQKIPRPVQHGKFGDKFGSREARNPTSEQQHHGQSQPETQHDAQRNTHHQRQQQKKSRIPSQNRRGPPPPPPHRNHPSSQEQKDAITQDHRQHQSTHPPNAAFPPRNNNNKNNNGKKSGPKANNKSHDPHHHNESHKARFNGPRRRSGEEKHRHQI